RIRGAASGIISPSRFSRASSPPGRRCTRICWNGPARRPSEETDHEKGSGMAEGEKDNSDKQLLHLVFGGELKDLQGTQFTDLEKLDIVGIYPNYATAFDAWKAA